MHIENRNHLIYKRLIDIKRNSTASAAYIAEYLNNINYFQLTLFYYWWLIIFIVGAQVE